MIAEAKKNLNRELAEHKERMEAKERKKAEERERLKAGNGMMLATPSDATALKDARRINTENARIRAEGYKPRAGSSKAMPTPNPAVNLAWQVQEDEWLK
jgi:hypothetical protein